MKCYGEITIAIVENGEPGIPASSIILHNESQSIPCTNTGLVLNNIILEIPFTAYSGTKQVASIVTVGLLPSGMTLGDKKDSTDKEAGIIRINIAEGTDLGNTSSGIIELTFKIGDITIHKNASWAKSFAGENGVPATIYFIEPSTLVMKKGADDVLSPKNITFNAYHSTGNSVDRIAYSGRFIIEESENGSTFTNRYLSNSDESTKTYTPSSSNVKVIKCTLCASGNIAKKLDTQSVIVLTDIDNIDGELEEIKKDVIGAKETISTVEGKIEQQVWRDTLITVVDENGQTVQKTLESLLVQHNVDLNGISSRVSKTESDFYDDNGKFHTLEEQYSETKQSYDGFITTIEGSYTTKEGFVQAVTNVTQKAGEIEQEVKDARGNETSLKQNIDGISQRVTNAEGNISTVTQTANDVKTEVESARGGKTSLKVALEGINADVTNNKNDISSLKLADGKFEVSIKETNKKIDEIEIGGRNLIANSNFSNATENWVAEGSSTLKSISDDIYTSCGVITTTGASRIYNNVNNVWKINQTYSVSFIAKASVDGVTLRPSRSIADYGETFFLSTEYKKYVCTIESTVTVHNGTLSFSFNEIPADIYITNVKLEKGNKATDWTPAPEDIDANIESVTNDVNKAIEDVKTGITTSYEAAIEASKTNILAEVGKKTEGFVDEDYVIEYVSNKLEITEEFSQFIKETTETLEDIQTGEFVEEQIKEWARFDGANLELGSDQSPFKAILTNTELGFYQGENKVAWISNNELNVLRAIITSSIGVGSLRLVDEADLGFSFILV